MAFLLYSDECLVGDLQKFVEAVRLKKQLAAFGHRLFDRHEIFLQSVRYSVPFSEYLLPDLGHNAAYIQTDH